MVALPLGLLASAPAASATSVQRQAVKPTGLVFMPNATGGGVIESLANPNRCIGIDSSGLAGLWNCTSNPDQDWQWVIFPIAPGWRPLENGLGQCLGVQGGSDAMGARVVGWPCLGTGHPDQYWNLGTHPPALGNTLLNYKAFYDPNTPASLIGIAGGSTWSDDGVENQLWF